jgi:hypothetical protein
MEDYTFLIGRRGESGFEDLVKMLRFDNPLQLFILVVEMSEDKTFFTKPDEIVDRTVQYHFVRKVHIPRNHAVIDVYYSDDTEMYYLNLAQAAKSMGESTERFMQDNIDGKFGPYCIQYCNGATRLVRIIE